MSVTTGRRIVTGTCHHDCPDSCGWHVTVEGTNGDTRAVQLRGNPAHPYSVGELCPKVNKFLDRVYDPGRVLHPLKRVGAKGEGRFEQITWDEALSTIAAKFQEAIDEHGPEAIMPYASAGNQGLLALGFPERFWNRLGATRQSGALCGAVAGAGVVPTNGTKRSMDPQELRHSKLIILWGTNTRLTNRHLWPTIEAARADGAQVVVIDPIRTMTASSADWALQPRPGTDVALMLAIMHVLIRDNLVDTEWVTAHTLGFDELAAHVAEWTPARAAEISGVSADDIERLATLYGTIRPAAIRTLIGAEHHEHGAMFFRTLTCLPALVGAWKDRGGGYARSIGVWTEPLVDAVALSRPELLAGRQPRDLNMCRLGEALTDSTIQPPITALVVYGANPMVATPNAELIRRGLLRKDLFTVVHEQFITDTARYADIVLPATTHIESMDVVPSWGHLWLGWNEPAIDPRGESVSNSELHRRLAAAMGFDEPALFDDDDAVIKQVLIDVDLDELRSAGFVRVPYPADGRPFGDGVFPTASGRVELVSEALASLGQPRLPTYLLADDSLAGEYPLTLLTPKQHTRFLNSSYSHLPKHGPAEGGPFVEMCADDAAARGLADGDIATIFNHRGSVEAPVRLSDRLRPGVVAVPWGWWSADHTRASGVAGGIATTANSLTSDTLTDWGGGVAYSDTLVQIAARQRP